MWNIIAIESKAAYQEYFMKMKAFGTYIEMGSLIEH